MRPHPHGLSVAILKPLCGVGRAVSGHPKRHSLRCFPVTPIGAFYLLELDRRLESLGVKYLRYMDDTLILVDTRWKLRKAVRALNRTLGDLKLAKHPDKTAIGRVERGFDFLDYHFKPPGINLAAQTLANCASKALRLYEQEPPHLRVRRLGEYLSRWHRWAVSAVAVAALCPCSFSAAEPRQAQEADTEKQRGGRQRCGRDR